MVRVNVNEKWLRESDIMKELKELLNDEKEQEIDVAISENEEMVLNRWLNEKDCNLRDIDILWKVADFLQISSILFDIANLLKSPEKLDDALLDNISKDVMMCNDSDPLGLFIFRYLQNQLPSSFDSWINLIHIAIGLNQLPDLYTRCCQTASTSKESWFDSTQINELIEDLSNDPYIEWLIPRDDIEFLIWRNNFGHEVVKGWMVSLSVNFMLTETQEPQFFTNAAIWLLWKRMSPSHWRSQIWNLHQYVRVHNSIASLWQNLSVFCRLFVQDCCIHIDNKNTIRFVYNCIWPISENRSVVLWTETGDTIDRETAGLPLLSDASLLAGEIVRYPSLYNVVRKSQNTEEIEWQNVLNFAKQNKIIIDSSSLIKDYLLPFGKIESMFEVAHHQRVVSQLETLMKRCDCVFQCPNNNQDLKPLKLFSYENIILDIARESVSRKNFILLVEILYDVPVGDVLWCEMMLLLLSSPVGKGAITSMFLKGIHIPFKRLWNALTLKGIDPDEVLNKIDKILQDEFQYPEPSTDLCDPNGDMID